MDKTTHNEDSHRKRANPARCRQCGDIIDVGDEANCIHMRDGFPVEDRWHEYKCRTIKSGSQEVQHFYQVAPRASAPQIKPEVSATPVPIRTEANVPSVNFIVVHDRDGGKMERLKGIPLCGLRGYPFHCQRDTPLRLNGIPLSLPKGYPFAA